MRSFSATFFLFLLKIDFAKPFAVWGKSKNLDSSARLYGLARPKKKNRNSVVRAQLLHYADKVGARTGVGAMRCAWIEGHRHKRDTTVFYLQLNANQVSLHPSMTESHWILPGVPGLTLHLQVLPQACLRSPPQKAQADLQRHLRFPSPHRSPCPWPSHT